MSEEENDIEKAFVQIGGSGEKPKSRDKLDLEPVKRIDVTLGETKTMGVALSGGVDSATAAFLLKQAGYELIGFHMHLTSEGTGCSRACCTLDSAEDARRVANHLDIPFYVLNLEEQFKREVIGVSRAAYKSGKTPNPCILCNRNMKFKYMLTKAREMQCVGLATGHYVKKVDDLGFGEFSLKRGKDTEKDQSYFLYFLDQETLSRLEFPLGWITKEGTRTIAEKAGLKVSDKPDSQDICFRLINEPDAGRTGNIVNESGQVLAEHSGVGKFTIGQRKGLGVAAGYALYVKEIDAESGDIVVAPDTRIMVKGLIAERFNLINRFGKDKIMANGDTVDVKVRYRAAMAPAKLKFIEGDKVEFEFPRPVRAVSPGQAAVIYIGDEMLGGGVIGKTFQI